MEDLSLNSHKVTEVPSETQMLDEISLLGYERPSINLLHHTTTILEENVVDLILKWLPLIYNESIAKGNHLIWALLNTRKSFKPDVLIDLYENSDLNETLKQTIAHILSVGKVNDLSFYLKEKLLNEKASHTSAGFLSAIAGNCNFKSRFELMEFVKLIFDKFFFYESIEKIYVKYGWKDDIAYLENKLAECGNSKDAKRIGRMINKIIAKKKEPIVTSFKGN
jgi:hypothetical protein